MKILYIWLQNKISDDRMKLIESNTEILGKNHDYLFITDDKNQFKFDFKYIDFNDIYKQALSELSEKRSNEWRLFCGENHTCLANFLRFYMGSKYPDLFYMDTDVELFSIPEFVGDKPYFAHDPQRLNVFYSNNRCDYMQNIIDTWDIDNWGYFIQSFKYIDDDISIIDKKYYKHHGTMR